MNVFVCKLHFLLTSCHFLPTLDYWVSYLTVKFVSRFVNHETLYS